LQRIRYLRALAIGRMIHACVEVDLPGDAHLLRW